MHLCCVASPAFACFVFFLECVWRSESSLSFQPLNLNQSFLSMHSDDLTPRAVPSGSMSNTLSKLFFTLFLWLVFFILLNYFIFCCLCHTFPLFPHSSLGPVWFKNLMAILCHCSGWQPWFPANIWSVFCQLVWQPQRVHCLQRSTWSAEPRKSTLPFLFAFILN